MKDLFFSIKQASVYKFANDNVLLLLAKTFVVLIKILTLEINNAINFFFENRIIVTPNQFKSIVVQNNKVLNLPTNFKIGSNKIDIECFVIECFRNQYLLSTKSETTHQ